MARTFFEWQKSAFAKFGLNLDEDNFTTDKGRILALNQLKEACNNTLKDIYLQQLSWMRRDGRLSIRATHTDGTISITQFTRTITGVGSNFTRKMAGQKIVIETKAYRVRTYISTTELTLDTEYVGTTVADVTYALHFDTLDTPSDFATFIVAKNATPKITYFFDDDLLLTTSTASSTPVDIQMIGIRRTPHFQNSTTNGTVAATADSATLTFSIAFVTTDVEIGMYIKVGTHGRLYEIIDVNIGAQTCTIEKGFGGTTGATSTFMVQPPGLQQIRFETAPTLAALIPYTYRPTFVRLEDDDEMVPVTSDADETALNGAIYRWSKIKNRPWKRDAQQDYEDSLAALGSIKNESEQETMPPDLFFQTEQFTG